MNYRHAFHAGNFADVVKHLALTAILLHLRKKAAPFAVVDTHAGRGLYDLSGVEAQKTGEARHGIGRLTDLAPPLPDTLTAYLENVRAAGEDRYPGSPLIAARLLRPQDRLVAIEKHPDEAALLTEHLAPFRRAKVEAADGYARLAKLLPPPERRGLILMDPPFEATDEFLQLAESLRAAYRRFATGIYLVWYPVKSQSAVDAFLGEVVNMGAPKALTIDIALPVDSQPPEGGKLARAGLLVLNPPYGFETAMTAILERLDPLVGTGRLAWLAGGP